MAQRKEMTEIEKVVKEALEIAGDRYGLESNPGYEGVTFPRNPNFTIVGSALNAGCLLVGMGKTLEYYLMKELTPNDRSFQIQSLRIWDIRFPATEHAIHSITKTQEDAIKYLKAIIAYEQLNQQITQIEMTLHERKRELINLNKYLNTGA